MTTTIDKVSEYNDLMASLAAIQQKMEALKSDPEIVKRQNENTKLTALATECGYPSLGDMLKTHGFIREVKKTTRKVLDYETKKTILERHIKGESASTLGEEFGIGAQSIYTWKAKGLKTPSSVASVANSRRSSPLTRTRRHPTSWSLS